ncbi:hypothetical protein HMSSN139_67390 [Paenibacillus sp. HMSSN-139]|nr:hypothetical protein HMSSN139_67390 [Paenibacillus sp. HMSSN-139]
MLGKASELRSELMDARELDGWLTHKPNANLEVVQIHFSAAGTECLGIVPSALIIYKEAQSHEQ